MLAIINLLYLSMTGISNMLPIWVVNDNRSKQHLFVVETYNMEYGNFCKNIYLHQCFTEDEGVRVKKCFPADFWLSRTIRGDIFVFVHFSL